MFILDNWYLFVIFVGVFLGITTVVLIFEARSQNDEILRLNPLLVIRNIILNQIGFYLLHLYVMLTVDVTGAEIFWWTQVFTSVEHDFVTKRGLLTDLGLILSLTVTCVVTTGSVRTYRNMLDYCFTIFVIHFIVVSIVENNFPTQGAWWVASVVGVILCMICSERLSYYLETMSYQSSLHEATYKSKHSKTEETELPVISESEEHFTSSSYSKSKDLEDEKSKGNRSDEVTLEETSSNRVKKERSSDSEDKFEIKGKRNSSNSKKHGSIEEKRLKDEEESDSESSVEEVLTKKSKSESNSPQLEKIPPNVKGQSLEEVETGKKDSLRAAKSREKEGVISSESVVSQEVTQESPRNTTDEEKSSENSSEIEEDKKTV